MHNLSTWSMVIRRGPVLPGLPDVELETSDTNKQITMKKRQGSRYRAWYHLSTCVV